MPDHDKIVKAVETLKGQSQQDELKKPEDVNVVGSKDHGATEENHTDTGTALSRGAD